MDWQDALNVIDALVFQQTDKHLDNLQVAILQGIWEHQKYAQIAQNYGCTIGHVKDTSYKLWRLLSKVLGEPVRKSNLIAALERMPLQGLSERSHPPHHGWDVRSPNINYSPAQTSFT